MRRAKVQTVFLWVMAGLILLPLLAVASYLAALFIVHDCNPDFLSIDSCLDSGGRWNYETRNCEGH